MTAAVPGRPQHPHALPQGGWVRPPGPVRAAPEPCKRRGCSWALDDRETRAEHGPPGGARLLPGLYLQGHEARPLPLEDARVLLRLAGKERQVLLTGHRSRAARIASAASLLAGSGRLVGFGCSFSWGCDLKGETAVGARRIRTPAPSTMQALAEVHRAAEGHEARNARLNRDLRQRGSQKSTVEGGILQERSPAREAERSGGCWRLAFFPIGRRDINHFSRDLIQ